MKTKYEYNSEPEHNGSWIGALILIIIIILSFGAVSKCKAQNINEPIRSEPVDEKAENIINELIERGVDQCDGRGLSLQAHYMPLRRKKLEYEECYQYHDDTIYLLYYKIYNDNGSNGFELVNARTIYIKFDMGKGVPLIQFHDVNYFSLVSGYTIQ